MSLPRPPLSLAERVRRLEQLLGAKTSSRDALLRAEVAPEQSLADWKTTTDENVAQALEGPTPTAPTESPAVELESGPRSLYVSIPPIASDASARVDVHVGTTSPLPVDATTLHGVATGSLYRIEALPDGTPLTELDEGTPIYVAVIAWNLAGYAPAPSGEVAGSLRKLTGPDVSVNAVWAGTVGADRIVSGTTEAEIVLAGLIEARGPSGQKVGLSGTEGFYSRGPVPAGGTDTDAPVYVRFPIDGRPNIVSGILEATILTVTDGASFRGLLSGEPEAVLTMQQGTQPPKAAPTLVVGYETVQIAAPYSDETRWGLTKGHDGAWVNTAQIGASYEIQRWNPDGSFLAAFSLGSTYAYRPSGGIVYAPHHGGRYYLLVQHRTSGDWYTEARDTAFGLVKRTLWTDINLPYDPCVGWDHTTAGGRLLTAYCGGDSYLHVEAYDHDSAGTRSLSYTWNGFGSGLEYAHDMGFIARGSFDYGGDRYVFRSILRGPTSNPYHVATTGGSPVRNTNEEWTPNGAQQPGGWWDGTRFNSLRSDGLVTKYDGGRAMWTSGSDQWNFEYSLVDGETSRSVSVTTTSGQQAFTATGYTFGAGDVGVGVSGTGIPAATTIASVVPGTNQAVLSNAATASGTVTATFTSTLHETPVSPRAVTTMSKRARVTVQASAIPTGLGGANDPDRIRVYYGLGTSPSMVREKTLAKGATTFSMNPSASPEGGSADPAFGVATPFKIASAGGGLWVDGKGDGSVGTAGFKTSVKAAAAEGRDRGKGTFTTNGSGDITISHNLGVTPSWIDARVTSHVGSPCYCIPHSENATTFQVRVVNVSNASALTNTSRQITWEVVA